MVKRYFISKQERVMYRKIYQILEETGKVKTAMVLNGNHKGEKCLIKENHCLSSDENTADFWKKYEADLAECQETKVVHMGDVDFFVEIYVKNPQLIIFGGGHVSQPVAKIGKMLGFHVTVMDDREDFVTSERFPDADRLIKGSYDKLSDKIPAYENAYYVIVTRGHLGDSACARQILRRPYTYLGMIGSKNKVKLTREKLLGEGFSEEQLNSIHAPIGLPIGGHGSIGGGNVEFQALKYAPEAQHGEIRKYNLSNQGGANLGMICGGEVEVLYELW